MNDKLVWSAWDEKWESYWHKTSRNSSWGFLKGDCAGSPDEYQFVWNVFFKKRESYWQNFEKLTFGPSPRTFETTPNFPSSVSLFCQVVHSVGLQYLIMGYK